jgi:hypothetical protein
MRRTSQLVGLGFSTGRAISPLPVNRKCDKGLIDFHDVSRASIDAQDEPLNASSPLRVREAPLASLGNRIAIENKTHRVHGGLSESIETLRISNLEISLVLTRQKCGRTRHCHSPVSRLYGN